jgi:hypothetical protein
MKKFNATLALFFVALLIASVGCKKAKENIIEEAGMAFLDGTEWKIVFFQNGSSDISQDFSTYQFRFNRDETVNAIRSNTPEATGNWKGNINNRTIYANFAAGTTYPLPLLNATWNITQSTLRTLTATTTVGTEMRQLRMEKL